MIVDLSRVARVKISRESRLLDLSQRNRLVQKHVDYATSLCRGIFRDLGEPPSVDLKDLVAYGHGGLVDASQRFDPRRGISFSTFCYYRIRGSVYDGLREMGWIPRGLYKLKRDSGCNEFLRECASSSSPADRPTTDHKMTIGTVANHIENLAAIFLVSADASSGLEPADPNIEPPEVALSRQRSIRALHKALATLPRKERDIIQYHYYEGLSLSEAAKRIGKSRSWGCRIHARAIKKLNEAIGKHWSEPDDQPEKPKLDR